MIAKKQSSRRPLISVMMPAFNAAKYLDAAVRSVLNQTYENWELIFVDDGSTDETLSIIQRFAAQDRRIRVFPMSHGGRGRARNICVENSNGEFIAVCDADDLSFPERFERQIGYLLSHPDVGILGSWWVPFTTALPGGSTPVRTFPTLPSELEAAFAKGKMRLHNATAMMRAELFKSFGAYSEAQKRAQDYEFFARLSRAGVKFAALAEPLIYYREQAKIASLRYFSRSNMYIAYADKVHGGYKNTFETFDSSAVGLSWRLYFAVKYVYFYLKMLRLSRRGL